MPILLLLAVMAGVRQFDAPLLGLLVQDIHGSLDGAAARTGGLAAVGGIAGMLAGFALGRLADHVHPPTIGKLSAVGAGLPMVPQGLAQGFGLLFGARFGMVFFAGGLDPVFQVWLAKVTPAEQRGATFGWACTAKSIGWIVAPLGSGMVASGFGVRSVYFVGAVLFLLLVPLIDFAVRRIDGGAERG
jgi:MFS family permease